MLSRFLWPGNRYFDMVLGVGATCDKASVRTDRTQLVATPGLRMSQDHGRYKMSNAKLKETGKSRNDPNKAAVRAAFDPTIPSAKSQEYYDEIKARFEAERDLRLDYRPEGLSQYTSDLEGDLAKYEVDPYAEDQVEREPLNDFVECLFIGGGFSALLTAARLRERGVDSIRIVERGSDVGGTWYWNRYPGAACDVSAYDYLPLLDEMGYVPESFFAKGPEI
ncbi:MAG: hypothetical protein ACI8PT_004065, partial [Gammaproteobacteria bacterium]